MLPRKRLPMMNSAPLRNSSMKGPISRKSYVKSASPINIHFPRMYGIESMYALPTPRLGTRRTSPPFSSTTFGVLSVELSTIRICAVTPARSMPSLHHSMNSRTVISSFIAGITMLNSTSSPVVWFGRRCWIPPAFFCADPCSPCITIGPTESEADEASLEALLSKIERAFLQGVRVPNHQDGNKTEHAPENGAALLDRVAINDRPGIHEYDLEVEQNEEHCHHIEFNAEPRLPFALRNHPAFIRGVFRSCAFSAFAYEDADEQC